MKREISLSQLIAMLISIVIGSIISYFITDNIVLAISNGIGMIIGASTLYFIWGKKVQ